MTTGSSTRTALALIAVGAAGVVAAPASAAVLTFDDVPSFCLPCDYVTEGYRITEEGGDMGDAGSLHIDITGGPFAASYGIAREDGGAFDATQLSVENFTYIYPGFDLNLTDDEIAITGYSGDTIVAEQDGSLLGDDGTLALTGFTGIDRLTIGGVLTDDITAYFDGQEYLEYIDTHFGIDDLVVAAVPSMPEGPAAVPAPPAVAGALGALALLAGLTRRRRRRA